MKLNMIVCAMFALFVATACQTEPVRESEYPRFEIATDEEEFPVSIPGSYDATVGWLVVQEDRQNSGSMEIRLPVAIIHAEAETKKSPVVYLSGGPGTSAMRTAAFPGAYPWLKDRDFIVFGQRGTHFAKPSLMCPEYREAVADNVDRIVAAIACKARLERADIGLQNYNTFASADDLEDLRSVLGLDAWSFYAGSYGTRLALIYAKSYGDKLESMVLDSPLPPNAIYDDESARNLELALRAIAGDCARDAACAAAFQELESRFFETINEVAASPLSIDGIERPVTAPDLVSLVPMSSESRIRNAPMTMDRVAKLDPALLENLAGSAQAVDFAWGMRFSVWCSEATPFSKRNSAKGPNPVLGGYESAAIDPKICEAWGVPPVDRRFIEPVTSDVPTLIIAGEFDPLTPPSWGKLAAETLSQSLVIAVRGGSHNSTQQWGGDGCAMSLAAEFFTAPKAFLLAPKTKCALSRSSPDYRLILE
ncbi:MAG: alpha/beta hydrolase [Pseudomonadota bacterium]